MRFNFNRYLAKYRLIKRYQYLKEVDAILEEYITERLMNGGSQAVLDQGRKDLVSKQNEIKENTNFINFLKKL